MATRPASSNEQAIPEAPLRPLGWPAFPGAVSAGKDEIRETFERTVDEGERRTHRTWPSLLSTGFVGGLDLGIGVFALLAVQEATGSPLLGALAFTIGFIALVLAKSELFTENFLVPIAAAVAGHAKPLSVARLWAGTLVMNLLGGWVLMALVMGAFPRLHATSVEVGRFYIDMGVGWVAFSSAIVGGMAITLMTWMERSTSATGTKVVAAVTMGFVLAVGPLNHSIVGSLEMFAALTAGAPFGYLDWFGTLGWSALGNMVGGIGLVTVLRLIQVGRQAVEVERARPEGTPRPDESGPQPTELDTDE